jgi:tRNA nucleotidyltransferase (CCA-adding enzyme)
MAGWEHFQHMADIGLHGWGASEAEAFEQAALALTAVVTELGKVRQEAAVEVACFAPDPELLLVDWLNAWVYEMSTRKMLFSRFHVSLQEGGLRGTGWGEAVDPVRHQPAVEVKGATYTALQVGQEADGLWHARCVVDV